MYIITFDNVSAHPDVLLYQRCLKNQHPMLIFPFIVMFICMKQFTCAHTPDQVWGVLHVLNMY